MYALVQNWARSTMKFCHFDNFLIPKFKHHFFFYVYIELALKEKDSQRQKIRS